MRALSLIVTLALFGSSAADAKKTARIATPSGQTDMQFTQTTTAVAASKLANRCMDGGMTIVSNSATEVVCEARMDDVSSVFTQVLMGNSYSTTPERYIRFALVQNDQNVRVQASSWVQLQMALGQTRREPVTSDTMHNFMMTFMESAGGSYLPGTSFGDQAYLGVLGLENRAALYKSKPVAGIFVRDVIGDGPAARAGMKPGDVIVAYNSWAMKKGMLDLFLPLMKPGKPYTLTVARGSQEVVLAMIAEPRPQITDGAAPQTLLLPKEPAATH